MTSRISASAFEDFYADQVDRITRRLNRVMKTHNRRRRVRNRPVVAELELSNWTGSGGFAGVRCPTLGELDGERQ